MSTTEAWPINDVADFSSSGRHTFHLSSDEQDIITAAGHQKITSVRATCSCGKTVTGLMTAADVFGIVQAHCRPL